MIRHRGLMSLYAIEDKTAVVVVASYHSVSRNPVCFKALYGIYQPGYFVRTGDEVGGSNHHCPLTSSFDAKNSRSEAERAFDRHILAPFKQLLS